MSSLFIISLHKGLLHTFHPYERGEERREGEKVETLR